MNGFLLVNENVLAYLFHKSLLLTNSLKFLLLVAKNRTHNPSPRNSIKFVTGRLAESRASDFIASGSVRMGQRHQPDVRFL